MEATGYTVFILGAVCAVAAIVGGNVSLPGGVKFGALASGGVRVALGAFGALLLLIGMYFIVNGATGPRKESPTNTSEPVDKGGCDNPKISLSKGKGSSGSKVTVKGTGFPTNADVEILFHHEAMTPDATDDTGSFEGRVTIPGTFDPFAPEQFRIHATTKSPIVCFADAPFQLTD